MPVIPEAVIEDVRSRTDIVSVIGDRLPLKRSSGGFVACCPFHHEKTPSFNINEAKGFYHCFGCGEDGDVINFVAELTGLRPYEAAKQLAAQYGLQEGIPPSPEIQLKKRNPK